MERDKITEQAVKTANKQFYDALADGYEVIDGRRSSRLETWLKGRLSEIRKKAPGGRLLDVGSGSGFLIGSSLLLTLSSTTLHVVASTDGQLEGPGPMRTAASVCLPTSSPVPIRT